VFLVVIAIYLAAIFWATSRRSSVTPATMAIGTGGGVLFGAVMYSVTPLGVNKYATNPWLPGSDVDPLVVLAWILLLGVPVAAAILAGRRYSGPAFPIIGLFMSMIGAACVAENNSAAGQGGPPRGGGPGQPGPAPDRPDGGRRVAADGGVERLTADPFPDPGRDDDEGRSDLVGAAAGDPMTQRR
jgi:hypothetical protein